jgi:hypothetical protein
MMTAQPLPQPLPARGRGARRRRVDWAWVVVGLIFLLVTGAVAAEFGLRATGCDIKGNISASGERIYHVPGQEYYAVTVVNLLKGERYFCSEGEARRAGWRRAKV